MKSVVKRRKTVKHYKMVIRDVVDTLKEYIIFLLMLVILLVFYVMRGSWGGHLGLFLDVVFLPVVLVGNWGYEFRMSQANEFGRDRYKASWVAAGGFVKSFVCKKDVFGRIIKGILTAKWQS